MRRIGATFGVLFSFGLAASLICGGYAIVAAIRQEWYLGVVAAGLLAIMATAAVFAVRDVWRV
jgi:hypothetical protein